jgi:hypothetical protein
MAGGGAARRLHGMTISPRISLAAAAIAAAALIAAPSQAADKDRVVRLTTKTLAAEQIDAGKPGPSLGDRQVLTEDVFRNGRRVGTSDVECTIVRIDARGFAAQCLTTTVLPGGQITAQGVVTSDQIEKAPFEHAVTGGTGKFTGASGRLTVDEAGDKPAALTFELAR